jgi:membrane fusion protein (multidrug efflux system)
MAFPVFPHPPPVRFQALRRAGRTACCLFVAGILCACGQGGSGAGVPPNPAAMAVPVMVLQIAPRQVPIVLEAVGQVQGSKEVEVRARVNGILLKRLFSEGSLVQAQAPLFQIDPAPYEIALSQARAQLAQERARLEQTRREAVRLKQLAEEHAISQKEFDDATSALKLSEATSQGAEAGVRQAELNLSYTLVTAPVSGVTGRMLRSEGSLITAGQESSLLAAIYQVEPIWVRFSLSESDFARLPGGKLTRATAEVRLTLPDGSRYGEKGRVNFAATQIDPRLATQELRAEFPNPRVQLLPGAFVRVQLTAGERDNVFLVPQTAVIQTEKGHFLFVLDSDSKAAIRPVQAGEWVGSDWMILKGLNAGDRVILDNLLKLRPGALVNPLPPAEAAGTNAAAKAAARK